MTPPCLYGIDIVPITRITAMISRYGDAVGAKVAIPDEVATSASAGFPEHCAALIAVKEATIKAIGGRPRGFAWRHVELVPTWQTPPPHIQDLFDEFFRATGVTGPSHAAVQVHATVASAATAKLGAPAAGMATWALRDDEIFAVVALWPSIGVDHGGSATESGSRDSNNRGHA